MKQYKILTLTDHLTHSSENSLYALMSEMVKHNACAKIDIASRSNPDNHAFFYELESTYLWVKTINESLSFDSTGKQFIEDTNDFNNIEEYDFIILRLPRPIPDGFFEYLESIFPAERIFNRPSSIQETGSKAFLLNFQDCCAPIKLCHSIEDIEAFKTQFPIVLKPLENYGGKGIVRIEKETVWSGQKTIGWEIYKAQLTENDFPILAMEFLKNVHLGDKRIIISNGEVVGTSLRLPAEGSWMCNVAQGGKAVTTELAEEEKIIVEKVSKVLTPKGIVLYGLDTLMGNEGKRVLSEINTLSIGGIPQAGILAGKPTLEDAVKNLWTYLLTQVAQTNEPRT